MKNNKYREYSERFILSRQNPQYPDVSKNYAAIKKQKAFTQQLRNQANHQVSYMKKLNQRLERSLEKKKKELNYVQSIRNRYISQTLKKQFLNDLKSKQMQKLKSKTQETKNYNVIKLKESKNQLLEKNKFSSTRIKQEMKELKSQKEMRESRLKDLNKSRVLEIEKQKRQTIENYHKFYQSRNKKVMDNFKKTAKKNEQRIIKDKEEVRDLEEKLIDLKKQLEDKETIMKQLNESIHSVREQSSQRSRKQITTRSMTPVVFKKYMRNDQPTR